VLVTTASVWLVEVLAQACNGALVGVYAARRNTTRPFGFALI